MSILLHIRKVLSSSSRISCAHTLKITQRSTASSPAMTMDYDKDPQPLFTDPETQHLLQSMTQLQIGKVFRKITVPDNTPEYKFMTTEQLEQEFQKTVANARKRLQMPPIVKVREESHQIISKDPALADFSDTKFVFTDITYGLRQSERKVVVRHTDGTLEYAPLHISKRVNQLYFPLEGRRINVPPMFEQENLQRCLDEHKYEFVLDRLIVQFEPYEADYHRISSCVYQHLNESKQFDMLRSTRHFGPMAFFYAWHRCIDDLLCDMIKRDFLRNGVELIALMYKLSGIKSSADYSQILAQLENLLPNTVETALEELRLNINSKQVNANDVQSEIHAAIGKTHKDFTADDLCVPFIEHYIKEHALKKVPLELALQTFNEINLEKKQLLEGLTKAHGLQQSN